MAHGSWCRSHAASGTVPLWGMGLRYTFGHELGHVTQHLDKLMLGASMPRRRVGNVTPDWIPKFRSAEHQAMVFGDAFLINDEIARGLSSADDISIQFGVSLPAARIYFEQMQEEIARPASSLRVLKIAEEVKAAIAPKEEIILQQN